jgi:hypothetical protein
LSSIGEQLMQCGVERGVAELRQRFGLDLADAFAGEREELADLDERARLAAVEPGAQYEDLALAGRERLELLDDLAGQQRVLCRVG